MAGAVSSFLETVFEMIKLRMAQAPAPVQALVTSLISGDLLPSVPHAAPPLLGYRICRERDGTTARIAKSSSVAPGNSGPGGKKPIEVIHPQPPPVAQLGTGLPCASKS